MLQVAKLAPRLLGESTALVRDFLLGRLGPAGGFVDRADQADLYYTVFGLEALLAISEAPPAAVGPYLEGFGDGGGLDLIELACLARAWAACGAAPTPGVTAALAERLDAHRHGSGGWSTTIGETPSVYATFLAVGAYQDLARAVDSPGDAANFLASAALQDGGYALEPGQDVATTPTTAAAVVALRQLGAEPSPRTGRWLRARRHRQGGFLASVDAPMPDLLSTAVALHALSSLEVDVGGLVEPTLDFVDSLWTNRGGFYGHWADEDLDCEYTYYGLLALGHLSVYTA